MTFLVTGGAGFIGSNIVEELLRRGHTVRVLDNFSTGRRTNIAGWLADIELVEGDIRSYHVVQKAMTGVDIVLHQAALPSVPRSVADPITTHEVNVGGTLNILDAAIQAGVKRVVYASSSSVYGDGAELPKRESLMPSPISPYAVSKLAGEHYCTVFQRMYRLETVALRYFNVFGPRQDPASEYSAVIPRFIHAMQKGHPVTVFGDGTQSRDFTYVANVVAANLLAASVALSGPLTLNCACGEATSLNTLVTGIADRLGVTPEIVHKAPRTGDVKHSFADATLARSEIGFVAETDLAGGLTQTVRWFGENRQ